MVKLKPGQDTTRIEEIAFLRIYSRTEVLHGSFKAAKLSEEIEHQSKPL